MTFKFIQSYLRSLRFNRNISFDRKQVLNVPKNQKNLSAHNLINPTPPECQHSFSQYFPAHPMQTLQLPEAVFDYSLIEITLYPLTPLTYPADNGLNSVVQD